MKKKNCPNVRKKLPSGRKPEKIDSSKCTNEAKGAKTAQTQKMRIII
jgi:hypothetical protein